MRIPRGATQAVLLGLLCSLGHADFKYRQQFKMTGGKVLQQPEQRELIQAQGPFIRTTMVKKNRLREELPNRSITIIDLDGRRFVRFDPSNKTYLVMTFDDFKAAMEHNQELQNTIIIPKFETEVTGASRKILGLRANETKMKVEAEFHSTDPQTHQPQSGTYAATSDAWMASVPGYDEVRDFRAKMAKELDLVTDETGGIMRRMNPADLNLDFYLEEFRKHATMLQGMPLLQSFSVGMAGSLVVPQAQSAQGGPQAQGPPPQPKQNTSVPTNALGANEQSLDSTAGGLNKQKQEQQQQETAHDSSATTRQRGSLMEFSIEVISFSSDPLDDSLFEVPAGYTQLQHPAWFLFLSTWN